MMLIKMAEAYLRQASARIKDSREALNDGLYAYALRLSQEAIELSLKAALKLVAIEYPKKHDVSDVLLEVKDRFPEWFRNEVRTIADISRKLAAKREVCMYGDEETFMSPDETVSAEEALKAVKEAEMTYDLCKRLLDEVKSCVKA
ncbi:MAG: HEPN domain-containing protein [Candidatus Nezhaarchaeales archaeon]